MTRNGSPPAADWWVCIAAAGCHRFALAGTGPLAVAIDALLLLSSAQRVAELRDGTRSLRRAVWSGERLDAVLFLSTGSLPGIDWLIDCFADPSGRDVLAGCAAGARVETGAQVCACFNVGARTIAAVVRAGAARIGAIGEATGAGTNCGSCKPALERLLQSDLADA